jgi:hypothetical protein
MGYAVGQIKRVFVKEMPPDNYENTARYSIQLDNDEWYSLGTGKSATLSAPLKGKEYAALYEGSTVEFLFSERTGSDGKVYKEAKRSALKVTDWAPKPSGNASNAPTSPSKPSTATTPTASPSSGSTARTGGSSNGTDLSKKDAGIEAGHAVNGAVALMAANGSSQWPEEEVRNELSRLARIIHSETRKLQNEILAGPKAAPVEPKVEAVAPPKPTTAPKPKAKPAPEPVAAESWEEEEDQIPF